jgi:hypothetical protein
MGCGGSSSIPAVYIDVDAATAADEDEQALVGDIETRVIAPSVDFLGRFAAYQDCQALTSVAIANPSPEAVSTAWDAVLPNVRLHAELYDFALLVVDRFQALLTSAIAHGAGTGLARRQLTAKSLFELFDIILRFDDTLTRFPRLLGDLSFFRRNASRHSDCEALYGKSNEMSMFFAIPSPLRSKVIGAIGGALKSPGETVKALEVFASLVDLFTSSQLYHKSADEEANVKQYRTIIGSLLCYDTIAPQGCFHAKAGVRTLAAVTAVSQGNPKPTALLNLLKYEAKHYKDATTMKQITAIIG